MISSSLKYVVFFMFVICWCNDLYGKVFVRVVFLCLMMYFGKVINLVICWFWVLNLKFFIYRKVEEFEGINFLIMVWNIWICGEC